MKDNTNNQNSYKGILRCSICGTPIHPDPVECDVVNPATKVLAVLHLCDECWEKYKEWKNGSRIS